MHKPFSWFLEYAGVNAVLRSFLTKKIYVLNYHSVSSPKNKEEFQAALYPLLSIEAGLFEEHIQLLRNNGHTFLQPEDLLQADSRTLHKPTIIYFDDGFKDVLANALPVLKKYSIRATVCATSGLMSRTDMLWTIKHRAYLLQQHIETQEIEEILAYLKTLPTKERKAVLRTEYADAEFTWNAADQNIFLSWEDLRVLRDEGWEIAAHSVSHPNLLELTSEELQRELVESKEKIEEELGVSVVSFSYPHGRWNSAINLALKKAGYKIAMSVGNGLNGHEVLKDSPVCLKTVPVKITDTRYELGSKLYSRHFLRS